MLANFPFWPLALLGASPTHLSSGHSCPQGGAAFTAQGTLRFTRSAGQNFNFCCGTPGVIPEASGSALAGRRALTTAQGCPEYGWGRRYGPRHPKVHPECWAKFGFLLDAPGVQPEALLDGRLRLEEPRLTGVEPGRRTHAALPPSRAVGRRGLELGSLGPTSLPLPAARTGWAPPCSWKDVGGLDGRLRNP